MMAKAEALVAFSALAPPDGAPEADDGPHHPTQGDLDLLLKSRRAFRWRGEEGGRPPFTKEGPYEQEVLDGTRLRPADHADGEVFLRFLGQPKQ